MISFKGRHTEKDIILQSVRWYLAYALSYRNLYWVLIFSSLCFSAFASSTKALSGLQDGSDSRPLRMALVTIAVFQDSPTEGVLALA